MDVAIDNNMKFNTDKCKVQVLHTEKRNQMHKYRKGVNYFGNCTAKKDLRIMVDHELNMRQSSAITKAACAILGCINSSFVCKTQKMTVLFY